MGTCFDTSARDDAQNQEINSILIEHSKQKRFIKTFVLTGTKNSGKTTILKQLYYLPETKVAYDNIEIIKRENIIKDIRQNCVDNIITLCEINGDQKSIQLLEQLSINNQYNLSQIGAIISNIWNKHQIKTIYKYRFSYGKDGYIFNDNMEIFFDKINEIMNENYNPTEQDIIKSKTNYYKIVEMEFLYNQYHLWEHSNHFNIIDIPHPIEKEFIHCFEAPTAVIFMASLTDYCINLHIDRDKSFVETENQMLVALDYFDKICNSQWFIHTPIVLFLNKHDLFRDSCIEYGVSLRQCFDDLPSNFPEYSNPKLPLIVPWIARQFGPMNGLIPIDIIQLIQEFMGVDNCVNFGICYDKWIECIKMQFENKNMHPHQFIYTHLLSAVHKENMQKVFCDVQHVVVDYDLRPHGII